MIIRNKSLKDLHTFRFDVKTSHYAELAYQDQFKEILQKFDDNLITVIGGGSNTIFTSNYHGLVLKNAVQFLNIKEKNDGWLIEAGGGVDWEWLVSECVQQEMYGLENLTLIPGTVGAAPVQNIGAYGVELSEILIEVKAIDRNSGKIKTFSKDDCQFGYRSSFFKNEGKGKFIIISVSLFLSKNGECKTHYRSLKDYLEEKEIKNPTIYQVKEAVMAIRNSKLPDPKEVPNAGSFFKNPVISLHEFERLSATYTDIPFYHFGQNIKIPAGWLIEKAGWKGLKRENVGVHDKQALVLIHHGHGKMEELIQLKNDIIEDISTKFGIILEHEVNIIN